MMATSTNEPPKVLPELFDWLAKNTPNKTFVFLPRTSRLEDGFFPLSYAAAAKAIDAMSWWLDSHLAGLPSRSTIAYIGPDDFRYGLILHAALKTGHPLLVPMLNNTPEALRKLLESTECSVAFGSPSHEHFWEIPRRSLPNLKYVEVPDIGSFIHDKSVTPYEHHGSYHEALDEVALFGQTSGTTGLPKQLTLTHRSFMWTEDFRAQQSESNPTAFNVCWENSITPSLLPLSWQAGLMSAAGSFIHRDCTPIILPMDAPGPLTPEYVHALGKHTPREQGKKRVLFTVPDLLKRMVRNPEYLAGLKENYDWIAYAGAPLDVDTGDLLVAQGIRVQSFIGSTDAGQVYPTLFNPDPRDWNLHRFHPTAGGYEFQPFLPEEGLYELCIHRQKPVDARPCFLLNPDLELFHTQDIWRKVEGREGFWQTIGRADDFVRLANVTKFNAAEVERQLESHPEVNKAFVNGAWREKVFVILELRRDSDGSFLKELLHTVNKGSHRDVWIEEKKVIISRPGDAKCLLRTTKGTVDRRRSLALFDDEIERLYHD